ncbi:MAG: SDR family oxidoreductase [Schleiferiaceae bacterium]|nr:SDR family oxidoreductase [Schleiferiaceae bacterium]
MATFEDQVIWITGASSGIGEALAYAFAKEGARLVLSARREVELLKVAANCKAPKANIMVLPLDLEDSASCNLWVERVLAQYGKVDILINNGGVGHIGYVDEMPESIERKVMEINFFGQINLTKALLPAMRARKSGKIVAISSILGDFGMAGLAAYAASKHAVKGYFESLRAEVAAENIQVLIVSPGFIKTEVTKNSITPDGKRFEKDSPAQEKGMPTATFAKKLLRAIKNNKKHVYIGRKEILAPYAKFFAPGLFYWLMAKIAKRKQAKMDEKAPKA